MKRSSTLLTFAVPCSIALALAAASPASQAQPDRGFAPAPEPEMSAPGDLKNDTGDPAERLRSRLEAIDAERARLALALSRLDAGEPWDRVRAEVLEQGGLFGQGDRFGQGERFGPGERLGQGEPGEPREAGGPDDGGPRPRGQFANRMDEAQLLELLTRVDPDAAERFTQMRELNPRMARRLLQSSAPRLQKLAMLEESDPALYEVEAEDFRLERQIMHTAMTLHAAIAGDATPDPATPSIDETRQRLRELVGRQVDLQIQGQRIKLASAKDRLERLGESIEARAGSRDSVIDDRVNRIMERAVRSGVNRRQRPDGEGGPPRRGPGQRPDDR